MKKYLSLLLHYQKRIRSMRQLVGWADAVKFAFAENSKEEIKIHLTSSGRQIVIRGGTSDPRCLEKVMLDKDYKTPFPIDPKIIVDAGANIGLATLFYAQEYPNAKIIAIEPERSNFEILQKNCSGLPNVILIEAALWNKEGTVVIQDVEEAKWMFSVTESRPKATPYQEVKAVTIPGILRDLDIDHIDILKLDIEGAEYALFGDGVDEWLGLVEQIAIELHDRCIPGCARTFYTKICRRSFVQENIGENIFIKFEKTASN